MPALFGDFGVFFSRFFLYFDALIFRPASKAHGSCFSLKPNVKTNQFIPLKQDVGMGEAR